MDAAGDGSGAAPCTTDIECGDRIACTVDHCDETFCTHVPCPDCCPDALACVVDLGCRDAPEPCTEDSVCTDAIRCTLDRCRDRAFCEHLPQTALCDDGESCFPALGCIPTPPDSCTTDEDCTGGRFCLGDWSCQPEFGCQFIAPPNCEDADACTADSCSEGDGGCVHAARDGDGDGYGDDACGGDDCADDDPERHPGAAEVCNGLDDDCDGTVDEACCTPDLPCTTTCGSTGAATCNMDGSAGPCAPPAETCNGTDDDCDGMTDEDFDCVPEASESCMTTCGTMGSRACSDTCAWGACGAGTEVCNGVDDDCDMMIDEGFACVASSTGSCTTSCSSTGTRACLGDCTWDTCTPPAEVCNGVDDDCDTAIDEGFTCVSGAGRGCTTGCGSTGSQTCNAMCRWPAACMPPAETCNGSDDDCDMMVDEGFACAVGSMGACTTTCSSTGSRMCLGDCTWDTCVPPTETCNGRDDDCDTVCDNGFTCCRGAVVPCTTLGYAGGMATCRTTCAGYITTGCTNCGNGMIDSGEQCDGTNLNMQSCTTVSGGFTGGTLRCTSGCTFDTTLCTTFTPSGIYDVAPRAMYQCAFFLGMYYVSYDIGTLTFTDTGSTLTVNGGRCPMIGPSARMTRAFSVSCTVPGSCDETYTLTGMFTDDDTWTGTYRSTFTPRSAGACLDCTNQMHSMSGTRR